MRTTTIRIIITASLLILFYAVYTQAEEITITTRDGTVTVGRLIRTNPDGVILEIPSGVKKIRYIDMPIETARKYGYDPRKAEAYKKQVEIQRKQADIEKKKEAYRLKAAELEKTTPFFVIKSEFKVGKIGKAAKAKIIQIIGGSSMLVSIGFERPYDPITVWIEGISTNELIDGQQIELPVLKIINTKSYPRAIGGSNTVFVLQPAM